MKFNRFIKFIVIVLSVFLLGNISYADNAQEALAEYENGVEYYSEGDYDSALECFRRATKLNPDYVDAYFNLGSLLEYKKQDREALEAFKQIVLRKPDDYEAVYKAAVISNRLKDYEKAKMYISLIPQDSEYSLQAKELAQTIQASAPKTTSGTSATTYQKPTNTQEVQSVQASRTAQDNTKASQKPQSYTSSNSYQKDNHLPNSNWTYENIPSPTGIAADSIGNIYVAGFSDNTIYKITPDNKKIVFLKDNKIDGPIGLAIDSQRNIYIANYNKNNVLKVSNGGEVTEFISNVSNPYCMFISGNLLFVSSQGDNSVIRRKLH